MKLSKLLVFLLVAVLHTHVNAQVLTDDQLYKSAYEEVQYRNWVTASAFLYAYIQRNPIALIKDNDREKKVNDAYNTCNKNITAEQQATVQTIQELNQQIVDLKSRLHEPNSGTHGLDVPTDIPPLPAPLAEDHPTMATFKIFTTPINGNWSGTLTSSNGSVFTGNLVITTMNDVVSGEFALTDNSNKTVTGIYDGGNLVLIRNTGVETIQTYILKKVDENTFSGSYKNEGKYPDDGSIILTRN